MKKRDLEIIGWREWVSLPELGIKAIKAKVDTGARSSSLHAFDMTFYKRAGNEYVKFDIHPDQKNTGKSINCHAKILEYRKIKSSNGMSEKRPVILTEIELLDQKWEIEVTLSNRDEMGFRMLVGRASIKDKFLVDSGKSFYSKNLSKPKKAKVKK
jgi:hypothetical protein